MTKNLTLFPYFADIFKRHFLLFYYHYCYICPERKCSFFLCLKDPFVHTEKREDKIKVHTFFNLFAFACVCVIVTK